MDDAVSCVHFDVRSLFKCLMGLRSITICRGRMTELAQKSEHILSLKTSPLI